MRVVFWLLVLAALAVGLSLAARYNEGYVLLVLPPWRAEVSLNLFFLFCMTVLVAGYAALSVLRHTLRLPSLVADFRERRAREQAAEQLRQAYRLMIEGRFGHAMRAAESCWPRHPDAGMVALVGWRAAHAMHDQAQVTVWRERAESAGADIAHARLMTEAELALEERRFDDAQVALRQLLKDGGRHIATLRLLLRAEQGLGNWREVARLVKQLERVQALSLAQAVPLRQRAIRESLRALGEDLSALQRYWRELDEADRLAPAIALDAANALANAGDCRGAQRVVEDALAENWDSALVQAYADCRGGDVLGRIANAEKWLHQHPNDEALLLTLGRLCRAQQLWGKARSFMEASIAVLPTRAAHVELAQLLDELQESALAARHYRAAATLA